MLRVFISWRVVKNIPYEKLFIVNQQTHEEELGFL